MSRRFTLNFINQLLAAVVIGATTFGLQIILARHLGPGVFGIYGIANSVAGIAFILQDGGFRTLIYREATHPTPRLPDYQRIFSSALGWNIATSAALLIACLIYSTLSQGIVAMAIALLVLTNLGRIVSLELSSLMRASDLFRTEAGWQITSRASVNILMIAAAMLTDNLPSVLVAGAFAQMAVLLLPSPRKLLRKPLFSWDGKLFHVCLTLIAIDFVTVLYFRSDVLMMAAFGNSVDDIGIYSALSRLIEAYIFVIAPVAVIFFRSARLQIDDRRRTARVLWLLMAIVSAPGFIALALTIQYHDEIVRLIFGARYQSGASYLAWLIAACCAAAPNALLGQALLAGNRDKYFLMSVTAALLVNLSVNATLIPTQGAAGAAQATFATEFSLMLFLIVSFYARQPDARITSRNT